MSIEYKLVNEHYGQGVFTGEDDFASMCEANGWEIPVTREQPDGTIEVFVESEYDDGRWEMLLVPFPPNPNA